jgi:DeoR/GlpR family transcriptional regulator of sugar metabolism
MFTEARHQRILQILSEQGIASVAYLAEALAVSKSTVRNDLRQLKEVGALRYNRGGALLPPEKSELSSALTRDLTYEERIGQFPDAKSRIGAKVAELFSACRTFMIDDGSTNLMVARALSKLSGLTVVTNGLNIIQELSKNPSNQILLCGGRFELKDYCVLGSLTEETISKFRAEVAIIGATGVTVDLGVTAITLEKRELKRAMVQAGNKVVLVVDSSKIGKLGLVQVCPLNDLDYLITDTGVSNEFLMEMDKKYPKVQVITV